MALLISIIGKGTRSEKDPNAYRTTKYDFGGEEQITSDFFSAIVNSNKYKMVITDACIIGTATSAWNSLLDPFKDKGDEEANDLYLQIDDEIESSEKTGITEQSLERLQAMLRIKYPTKKIVLKIVGSELTNENAVHIIDGYLSAMVPFENHTEIYLDITHGFRSMPFLMLSAIRLLESVTSERKRNINLIYGEYVPERKISYVRDMGCIENYRAITNAVNLFFSKYEPENLVEYVTPYWSEGARAIGRFGNTIQANFYSQLEETLRQAGNSFEKYPENKAPVWLGKVREKFSQLIQRIEKKETSHEKIFEVAELLAEANLFGNAMIALMISFEAWVMRDDPDGYTDWEKTNKKVKKYISKQNRDRGLQRILNKLKDVRNSVAHGGTRSRTGGLPQPDNLRSQFDSYKKSVSKVFNNA